MQVPAAVRSAEISFVEVSMPVVASSGSTPCISHSDPVAVIKCGSISIEKSNDISETILGRLLQEVSHA